MHTRQQLGPYIVIDYQSLARELSKQRGESLKATTYSIRAAGPPRGDFPSRSVIYDPPPPVPSATLISFAGYMRVAVGRETSGVVLKGYNQLLRSQRGLGTPMPLLNTANRFARAMNTRTEYCVSTPHRQLSFATALASAAAKRRMEISNSERIPNPYLEGSRLNLSFTCDAVTSSRVVVEIVKAFTPFTCSQTLLVRRLPSTSPSITQLPDPFVLKLADIRFTPRPGTPDGDEHHYAWTHDARDAFAEGARRVRSCEWGNEWEDYIPGGRPPRGDETRAGYNRDTEITRWSHEMNHYYSVQASYDREKRAYQVLRALQGRCIPRFYGTVSLVTGEPEPLLSSVRGVALEYIDGRTLEYFKPGVDISKDQAQRVVQATLRAVRRIRDCFIAHNDLALRNVMLRRLGSGGTDFDFEHPVIIDFGLSDFYSLDTDDYDSLLSGLRQNLSHARRMFSYADWHVPSLYLGAYQPDKYTGYARANGLIDNMYLEMRDRYFDEIPVAERAAPREVIDDGGEICMYEPAHWILRPHVRGNDADVDWEPSEPRGT